MIEDDLRAAMLAHDHEAPTADEFRFVRPPRRTSTALAVAACVLGVLVASTFLWRANRSNETAAASSCPAGYTGATKVPAQPTGVNAADQLVPTQTPTRVVICAYLGPAFSPAKKPPRLTGYRLLTGDLAAVSDSLADQPRTRYVQGCTQELRSTDGNAYLIAITYKTGMIWVSAPADHCAGSTNGSFASSTNLGLQTASAYAAGRWSAPKVASACEGQTGRLGDDAELVPDRPTSVFLCPVNRSPRAKAQQPTSTDFHALINALNDLPTSSPDNPGACEQGHGLPANPLAGYTLVFRYATGPGVAVRIMPNCRPNQVQGGTLEAKDSATIRPLVDALFPGH